MMAKPPSDRSGSAAMTAGGETSVAEPAPAVEPAARGLVSRRVRPPRISPAVLLALAAYVAFTIFLTWPLATDPGGSISETGLSGDLAGSVSRVAYVVQHHVFPFAPARLTGLDAPQGLTQSWVVNLADVVGQGLLYGLGYVFGAVTAHALYLWLGFVASAMSMFLLTRRLFGSTLAALLAGFVFGFSPWAVTGIAGHYDYMQGWVLVLSLWRMLELAERPTVRNGLLAGAATVLAMLLTAYFLLIAAVGFATTVVVVLVAAAARGDLRATAKSVAAALVPIVAVVGVLGVITVFAGGSETGAVRTESITELYTYSARFLEWLLPDRHNLIFGGLTGPYRASHLHGGNFVESALYLGDSVIVLAVVGLWLAVSRLRREGRTASWDIRVLAAMAGVLVALVAAWFSAPPKVHLLGVWVPTPSFVVFHLTTTFRVYSRFVELIELGLCIPMAFALSRLFARPRGVAAAALFAAVATVLVLDLWARPPIRATKIVVPPEYVWLKDHPGGIVADYPIEPAVYPNYSPLLWQTFDHHPLFQGYDQNTEDESMKLDMGDPQSPTTPGYLADLGVRYIVVHPGEPEEDVPALERRGYRLRYRSPHGSVLQVDAAPAATRVDALAGFSLLEGTPGNEWRWMDAPGVLGLYARNCPVCAGVVSFASSSADVSRLLTVREQETNAVLARLHIPAGRQVRVTVPNVLLRNGQARLLLSTDIPPELPNNGDPRTLSVTVVEPHLNLTSH